MEIFTPQERSQLAEAATKANPKKLRRDFGTKAVTVYTMVKWSNWTELRDFQRLIESWEKLLRQKARAIQKDLKKAGIGAVFEGLWVSPWKTREFRIHAEVSYPELRIGGDKDRALNKIVNKHVPNERALASMKK